MVISSLKEDAMSIPDKKALQLRLGAALKLLRQERGLLESDVAERMGKKKTAGTQVSRWERGEAAPIATQLWAYLQAIDASFADLDRVLDPKPSSNRRLRDIARELQSIATGKS